MALVGIDMKNELIKLPTDQVTISDKGRAAACKWKPGDKPFVQFLAESELEHEKKQINDSQANDEVEEIHPVDSDENSAPKQQIICKKPEIGDPIGRVTLNIGSRLEFQAPPRIGNLIIRSTTRINMNDGPQSCETHWEVYPGNDSDR